MIELEELFLEVQAQAHVLELELELELEPALGIFTLDCK